MRFFLILNHLIFLKSCFNGNKIKVEEADDIKHGFTIRFFFKPNDFFENEKVEHLKS